MRFPLLNLLHPATCLCQYRSCLVLDQLPNELGEVSRLRWAEAAALNLVRHVLGEPPRHRVLRCRRMLAARKRAPATPPQQPP